MQKVLGILERYVEYIVLGLGALFLGFMAWSYLVKTPVTVEVAGQNLRPGEIDDATVRGPVDALERKMASSKAIKAPVPDFKKGLAEELTPPEPEPFATWYFLGNGAEVSRILRDPMLTPGVNEATVVKSLPKIPAPELAQVGHGRSNVVMPPADWIPGTPLPPVNVQALLAPPPGAPGAFPVNNPRPGQPAPLINPARPGVAPPLAAQPGAPAAGQAFLADKDWVTVMYHLPMKQIADAFTSVNIPQGQQLNLFKTCILDIDLIRQEIVDGKPVGDETVVKKLEISATPPFPNGIAEELQYVGWATASQGQIIQPGFFQIARGDPWLPPGVDLAMQNGVQQPVVNLAFDQSKPYTPAELRQLTPEQFAQVKAYRQQQAEQRRQQRSAKNGSRAPTRGEGLTPDSEMAPEVPDLSRMEVAQLYPGRSPDYDPSMEDPSLMEGMQEGQQGQQQFQMAPATFAQFPLPPAGEFDPRMAPEPTVGWAHDDTVQPGKAYRYKLHYKIKNPVFQIFNITQPKDLSNVFAITSPDSNWSEPISIPPLTRFFVVTTSLNNSVRLEIFRWQDGQLHSAKASFAPGDIIQFKDPTGVDFSTGWTLVDVPTDPSTNQPYVVVADPAGNLVRRDFKSDSNDPEYQQMKSLIPAPVAQR